MNGPTDGVIETVRDGNMKEKEKEAMYVAAQLLNSIANKMADPFFIAVPSLPARH